MTIPSPSAAEAPGPDIQADTDIIDLLDESVIVMGLNMHVRAWNAEAERLYGWKREEVIGGKIQAAVKCSPNEPLKVILAKVQETGLWRGEFSRTTKQGKTVTVKAKWSLRRSRRSRTTRGNMISGGISTIPRKKNRTMPAFFASPCRKPVDVRA